MSEPFRPRQAWAETMRTPVQVPDLEALTPEAALEVWRDHGSCDSIGPGRWWEATEVIEAELERLQAMEARAREMDEGWASEPSAPAAGVARYILNGES